MTIAATRIALDLTPPVLYSSEEQCVSSIAALGNALYLATCQISIERSTVICTVYRHNSESELWQSLEQRTALIDSSLVAEKPLKCNIFTLHTGEKAWVLACFIGPFISRVLVFSPDQYCQDIDIPVVDQGFIVQQLLYGDGYIYALLVGPSQGSTFGRTEILRTPTPFEENLNHWETLSHPSCLAKTRQAATRIVFWDGHLYASVSDPVCGFGLWMLDLPTREWQPVLSHGLYRYSLNSQIDAMAIFKENLYLSTGLDANNRYLNTPELACIYPTYDWDLILGSPRFTPTGLRVPLFLHGIGRKSSQLLQLITHEEAIYLCCQSREGLEIWFSTDGIDWRQLAMPNLEQYLYVHFLEIASSSEGLILLCTIQNISGVRQRRLILYR